MGEAVDTIPPLPKVGRDQVRGWTDTTLPWERKEQVLYRENDVLQILENWANTNLPRRKQKWMGKLKRSGKLFAQIMFGAKTEPFVK